MSHGPAFFLLNTNRVNDPRDDAEMLARRRAAAYFTPWKHQIERLRRGDVVFLYRSGAGIVAFGRASGRLEIGAYHGDPRHAGEEYAMALERFTRLDTPLPAADIRWVAERNISFQQTLSAVEPRSGERILRAVRIRAA